MGSVVKIIAQDAGTYPSGDVSYEVTSDRGTDITPPGVSGPIVAPAPGDGDGGEEGTAPNDDYGRAIHLPIAGYYNTPKGPISGE